MQSECHILGTRGSFIGESKNKHSWTDSFLHVQVTEGMAFSSSRMQKRFPTLNWPMPLSRCGKSAGTECNVSSQFYLCCLMILWLELGAEGWGDEIITASSVVFD